MGEGRRLSYSMILKPGSILGDERGGERRHESEGLVREGTKLKGLLLEIGGKKLGGKKHQRFNPRAGGLDLKRTCPPAIQLEAEERR